MSTPVARSGEASETDASPLRSVSVVGGGRVGVDLRGSIDSRIEVIADQQRARVARAQLIACGVSPSATDRRVRSGRLERVHDGVYALPHTSDVPLAPETAALLACGEDAVLSHHSAITLYGLRAGSARPIHVTIRGDRGFFALEGVKLHRSRILAPRDIRIHHGLPLTSPARALLDAAATLPDRDVELLLAEGLFALRLLTRAEIADVLARAGGHSGRARLARVSGAGIDDTRTDSRPEERLFGMIRAAGLPEPRTQVHMLGYILDFFWPELHVAVEVDAYGTHGSRTRFEADRRRDARLLTEKGIVVLRLTRVAIEERPFEAISLLARAIGRRESRYDAGRSRSW